MQLLLLLSPAGRSREPEEDGALAISRILRESSWRFHKAHLFKFHCPELSHVLGGWDYSHLFGINAPLNKTGLYYPWK